MRQISLSATKGGVGAMRIQCRLVCVVMLVMCANARGGLAADPVKIDPTKQYDLEEGLDLLSRAIREKIPDKSRIAVSELGSMQQEKTHMGKFVSEELTIRLTELGGVRVVERSQLNKVVNEQKLGTSSMWDDDTAARIGKLVGADTIAAGTYTDLGKTVRLSIRMIHSSTAEVIAAKSITLLKTEPVAKLLNQKASEAAPEPVKKSPPGLIDKTADDISKAFSF